MQVSGNFRIHFNRHNAAPLVWSIATDEWELSVMGIVIESTVRTVYRPKDTDDDEDGRPSAWLETHGTMTLERGIATITDSMEGIAHE